MTRFIKYLLNEAKTSQTEDLHEIFFALSVLGEISNDKSLSNISNLTQLLVFINKIKSKLGKTQETIDMINNYIEGDLDSKQLSLLKDANKAGAIATKAIINGYNIKKNDIVSVERVFGAGESGTKIIADDKVIVNIKSGKDTIAVSLKYGAGQFNNLSVNKIIKSLYGINLGSGGILANVYKTNYGKKAIDNALQFYVKSINDNENIDIIPNNIKYPQFKKYSAKDRTIYRKAYKNLDKSIQNKYLNMKMNIHNAMDVFFDDNKSPQPSQDDYVELLSYLLRAEPDTSYLYVAKGGAKTFFIPSQDALRNHEFEINVKKTKKTGGSYKRDIDIKVGGNVIIGVDLNFRWSQGQFMGEYSQKGSRFNFDKNFKW